MKEADFTKCLPEVYVLLIYQFFGFFSFYSIFLASSWYPGLEVIFYLTGKCCAWSALSASPKCVCVYACVCVYIYIYDFSGLAYSA